EAQLAQKDYRGAQASVQAVGTLRWRPATAWERQYLLCRIQLAAERAEEALQGTTNLLALANNTAQRPLQAETAEFRAGILEHLGRAEDAIAAYTNNLTDGIPAARQRQALLKIAQLSLAQNKIS